jgi:hypothetical protein
MLQSHPRVSQFPFTVPQLPQGGFHVADGFSHVIS